MGSYELEVLVSLKERIMTHENIDKLHEALEDCGHPTDYESFEDDELPSYIIEDCLTLLKSLDEIEVFEDD